MKRSTPLRTHTRLQRKKPLRNITASITKPRPMRRSRPKMTPARRNAKGQPCTLRFPGCYPGPNNEQVQLCHLRMFGGGGTGLKPHDGEAVFGCTHCHSILDGRARLVPELSQELNWEHIARALVETLRLQRAAGVITWKGES